MTDLCELPGLSPLDRRNFLTASAGVAASAIAAPYLSRARADEPIKIGMVWAKTGQITQQAEYLAQGSMLALEQRGGKLLGRPVELVWLDEPNPHGAQQSAQRLVQGHKVVGLLGGALSSFALAISSVANKAKVPYIAANAAAGSITGASCNRCTFRLQPPVDVHTKVLAPYCALLGKKWYLLTASYAFGQDIKKAFTNYMNENGGEVVGADEAPLNTPDFSSFILKIRAAKPDVVIGGLSANDLTTFLEQWNELGMRGKIPFAEISVGNTDIWGVGPEAPTGSTPSPGIIRTPAIRRKNSRGRPITRKNTTAPPPTRRGWVGWRPRRSTTLSTRRARPIQPRSSRRWSIGNNSAAISIAPIVRSIIRWSTGCWWPASSRKLPTNGIISTSRRKRPRPKPASTPRSAAKRNRPARWVLCRSRGAAFTSEPTCST